MTLSEAMTYEEKLALLDSLRAEVEGKPHVIGNWELQSSGLDRADEPEPVDAAATVDQRHGIAIKDVAPGEAMGRSGLPVDFVDKMYRYYLQKRSLAKTAVRFNRTRQSVWDTFRRRGFKLRKDSKARSRIELTYKGVKYAPSKDDYLRGTTGERAFLHVLIWTEANGAVPEGHCITFKDGNRRNFDLGNLECVTCEAQIARARTGENGATKERRISMAKKRWKPKAPNSYDIAFYKWFCGHAFLVREFREERRFEVLTNGNEACRFRVNGMLMERLVGAGFFVVRQGSNRFTIDYGLAKQSQKEAA